MNDDRQQKELFDFDKPKRSFQWLRNLFSKADFENNIAVTLTLDKLILAVIGLLMLFVIIYAVGVEAGRREFREVALKAQAVRQMSMKPAPVKIVTPRSPSKIPAASTQIALNKPRPGASPAVSPAHAGNQALQQKWFDERPYSILIATFTRKDNALNEVAKLKRAGYNPLAIQSGDYIYVYSGVYKTKDDAIKDLVKLKKYYRDAFIKVR